VAGDRLGEEDGGDVPAGVAVDEHRGRAELDGADDRTDERERRAQHGVAGAHAGLAQEEADGGGAAGEPDGVDPAGGGGHLGLEGVQVGAGRRHPTALDGGDDRIPLGGTDVGWRQVEAAQGGRR
jgi:hypothetical protein